MKLKMPPLSAEQDNIAYKLDQKSQLALPDASARLLLQFCVADAP
jgi:hypothetical protein